MKMAKKQSIDEFLDKVAIDIGISHSGGIIRIVPALLRASPDKEYRIDFSYDRNPRIMHQEPALIDYNDQKGLDETLGSWADVTVSGLKLRGVSAIKGKNYEVAVKRDSFYAEQVVEVLRNAGISVSAYAILVNKYGTAVSEAAHSGQRCSTADFYAIGNKYGRSPEEILLGIKTFLKKSRQAA